MTPDRSHLQGYLAILAASVLYASSVVAARWFLRGIAPVTLSHASALGVALFMFLGTGLLRPRLLRVAPGDLWRFAALGIFGFAATSWLINRGLQSLNAAAVLTLHYTFPAMTLLYARLRGTELADRARLTAVVSTLAGCALSTGLLQGGLVLDPPGVAASLGSAVAFSFVTIFSRSFPRPYSPITLSAYTYLFASLAFQCVGSPGELRALVETPGRAAALAGYVLFLCIGPNLLLFYGLQRITPTAAGVICSFEIVAASLLAWAFLGETLGWEQMAGAGLVVAGVLLIELSRRREILNRRRALGL